MPEGLVIVWQSDASSSSPGGSIKVFIGARGGLCDCMAVRCQLWYQCLHHLNDTRNSRVPGHVIRIVLYALVRLVTVVVLLK
jgi:hypothetical protein